uniref:Uncharacterized protein n=1 Tax=Oryza sativa subsp. japonica TaxID=39947 RepID=Q84UK6_ORYSJ|nr:hypothetical protein [Oryza sativa Japonica Group]BAD33538.1 hypothetical protein [Oryza sativa Japonica Group]
MAAEILLRRQSRAKIDGACVVFGGDGASPSSPSTTHAASPSSPLMARRPTFPTSPSHLHLHPPTNPGSHHLHPAPASVADSSRCLSTVSPLLAVAAPREVEVEVELCQIGPELYAPPVQPNSLRVCLAQLQLHAAK